MSLKENIDYVKQELSTEEKFMASFVKVEQFYKRYKNFVFGGLGLIVVAIAFWVIASILEENRIEESNQAYNALMKNPDNTEALKALKEQSPELLALYELNQAIKSHDTALLQKLSQRQSGFIQSLAAYHLASAQQNAQSLERFAAGSETKLKDLAYLQEAFLLLQENRFAEAKNTLGMIGFDSPVKPLANMLEHYTVKGNQ